MRSCTLNISDMGFGCMVDLRFDDVPDTGPASSIISVMALGESPAIMALQSAIEGDIPVGPIPSPVATVYDQEGLESLTLEHLAKATRKYPLAS